MILHGVVAYLAGLWLGPFLSLFPLSLLGALLSFGLFLTWFEQRGSLSRWGGFFLFAVVMAGMGQAHWAAMSKIESPLLALSHEHPVKLQGVIVAPVRHTPDGVILLVEVQRIMSPGKPQPIHGRIRLVPLSNSSMARGEFLCGIQGLNPCCGSWLKDKMIKSYKTLPKIWSLW